MRRSAWAQLAAILLTAACARAAPSVDAGDHYILPGTSGTTISIYVASNPAVQVQGLELYAQIGDGTSGPVFQDADVLTGTIFDGNNPGLFPGSYVLDRHLYQGVVTQSGTVAADGLLATLTIDTTGVTHGRFDLLLSNDLENSQTNFAGVPAVLTNGKIIVPRFMGDADTNDTVNSNDLDDLLGHFGQPSGAIWPDGDFNFDGAVDDFDLSLLLANYESSAGPDGGVPEPTALCILLAGAGALLRRRR